MNLASGLAHCVAGRLRRWASVVAVASFIAACGGGGSESGVESATFKPYGLAARVEDASVTLTWPRINGATAYNVYWSTTPGVTITTGTKIAAVAAPYAHTGLTNGTPYYYVYTVETAEGESVASSELSAAPGGAVTGAPTGVAAYSNNGQVNLTWSGVAGAESYNVYWKTARGVTSADTKVADATSPFVLAGTASDQAVYFAVTAVVGDDESALSSEVAAMPFSPEPMTPVNVGIVAGDQQTTLSWSAVPNATSYTIYWNTSGSVSPASEKIAGVSSPYVHKKRSNGQAYYYVVVANNAHGPSAPSAEVGATPAKAVGGVPSAIGATSENAQATVTWAPVSGADSYNIQWIASGVTQSTNVAAPPYVHAGLAAGILVRYTVTAVTGTTESAASTDIAVVPAAAVPSAPTRIKAFAGHEQVTLNTDTPGDAVRYDIYWYTSGNVSSANARISDVTLPYTHTGLSDGTRVYYRVAAVERSGASALAAQVAAEPQNYAIDVIVTDPVLQACVDSAAAANGWSYARQVERVFCYNKTFPPETPETIEVTNISGIEKLSNLLVFHLGNDTTGVDVSAVASLANLDVLTLSGVGMSSASVVAGLTNLVYLDLYDNQLGVLDPLQNLTDLTELYVGLTNISDIAPLATLTNLRVLYLNENSITSIDVLANLTHLTELSLYLNLVADVTPLTNLAALTRLSLEANQVVDVSSLANLTALQELYLASNLIGGSGEGKVDKLKALTQATIISLGGNLTMSCSEAQNLIDGLILGVVDLDNNLNTSPDALIPSPAAGANCTP